MPQSALARFQKGHRLRKLVLPFQEKIPRLTERRRNPVPVPSLAWIKKSKLIEEKGKAFPLQSETEHAAAATFGHGRLDNRLHPGQVR